MANQSKFHGMSRFLTVWAGQICSLIGSALTDFALGLWVYRETKSITLFAFIMMFAIIPQVVLAPISGALADRWDRRKTMIGANVGAAFVTLSMALLHSMDSLSIGAIYVGVIGIAVCSIFLRPAFGSSTVLLVPKEQLGRANGLVQTGLSTVQIVAPILAGALVSVLHIGGILLLDAASYVLAIGALLLVKFPPFEPSQAGGGKGKLWANIVSGWQFLVARPGLLRLLGFMAAANVILGISSVLVTPLVLSVTGPLGLGTIMSIGGIGMIVGSMVLTIWGGPAKRINGILGFMLIHCIFLVLTGVRPSVIWIGIATFGAFLSQPIFLGLINVILQSKVPRGMQGRVFGTVIMIALSTQPIAFFISGPLSEMIFNPLLREGGALAGTLGPLLGVGPERGLGLLFVTLGLLGVLLVLVSFASPRLSRMDDELPDAGTEPPPAEPALAVAAEGQS